MKYKFESRENFSALEVTSQIKNEQIEIGAYRLDECMQIEEDVTIIISLDDAKMLRNALKNILNSK